MSDEDTSLKRLFSITFAKRFLYIVLPAMAIMAASSFFLYTQKKRSDRSVFEESQKQIIQMQKKLIINELNPVVSDLFYLVNMINNTHYLVDKKPDSRLNLLTRLKTFSQRKKAYNHIEIFDQDGKEIFRLFYNQGEPRLSPAPPRLSSVPNVDFVEIMKLTRGNIYISSFKPVQPIAGIKQPGTQFLSFGVPVFSEAGAKQGAIILHLRGENIFGHLRKTSAETDSQLLLINESGLVIFSADTAGQLRPNRRFDEVLPVVWSQIASRITGHIYHQRGLFTYTTFDLFEEFAQQAGLFVDKTPSGQRVERPPRAWKIVSFLPATILTAGSRQFMGDLLIANVFLAMLLILVSGALALVMEKRRIAEKALKQRELEYRDLYENAPLAYLSLDPSGSIIRANKRATQIFELSESELLGESVVDLFRKAAMEEPMAAKLRTCFDQGVSFRNEQMQIRRKSGKPAWVSLSCQSIYSEKGTITGHRVTVVDITEQKNLEQQFYQAVKMEAIGRLAGGVAHDFNNLLTVMTGYLSFIEKDVQPDTRLHHDIKEVMKAVDRATDLIQQLLAFSRRQIIKPRVLNLNDIIKDLQKLLIRILGEDIQLEVILAKDTGNILADRAQMEQILMNLVVNSREAMPNGGHLTIETANIELDEEYARHHLNVKPGSYVMLSVSDTGMGMDEETKSHIFEPFFTTKKDTQGTGLGLSTVYGIVNQNGGTIWVYSEPGEGTTFKIYLPRVDKAVSEPQETNIDLTQLRGDETILLVEDEPGVREFAKRCLKDHGYRVYVAGNGKEAIELGKKMKDPIHLLLTDVVMPGMSGRQVYLDLQKHHPEMEVLYISGYTDNAIVHHGVLATETAFLQKPFNPETLLQKVRETIERKKRR